MEGEVNVSESAPVETAQPVNETPIENVSQEITQQEQPQQDGKPEGFDRVELPPEAQKRFDRVYGNMKRYETDAKELREINQQLINTVQQLYQGQQDIVSHLQVSDYQEAEQRLSSERDAAWQKGDIKAYNSASDQLSELKIKKNLAERERTAPPKAASQPQQQPQGMAGERIVNRALEQNELTSVDANIAKAWMAETDTTGNLKRSWTQQNDPMNYAAALEGQAVFNSPMWANRPIADKLREIDRRMGIQQAQAMGGQNVMPGGNLTRGKPTNTIKLNPDIERVAIRTKFAATNPKLTSQQRAALTDRDHVEAWKQVVYKSQSKGAKR